MELRLLRYFDAVCEARSFVHAADRLHMAQPPLSRSIQQLEAEIGVPLIRRGVRPLELTEAGRFLFEQGRQLLGKVAEIEAATRRIGQGNRRFFGIGYVGSTLYGVLPLAIRRFREAHPDVEIVLSEVTTHQQHEALVARRIDVGFGRLELAPDPVVTRETIVDEALVLACEKQHAFADRTGLSLADIASEAFVLYPGRPRPSFADLVLAIFQREGLTPRIAIEANDVQTALGLVAAGMGVTLVPASVSRQARSDVAFLPVDAETARSSVIMGYRKGDPSQLLASFLALARGS